MFKIAGIIARYDRFGYLPYVFGIVAENIKDLFMDSGRLFSLEMYVGQQ